MESSKRFDRILKLFFILQSKAVVTIDELENRLGISRRTIYRDINALADAGVPLTYESGKGHLIMEGYRIQPSRFTQEEISSLMIAEKIIQQHETQFIKQHFESALTKIKGSFQFYQKNSLIDFEDKLQVSARSTSSDYLPNVINILLSSTVKKLICNISYFKSSDTQPTSRRVEPIGLFYESGFWYVLVFCHLRKDYRNFRLDRIKKVSLSEDCFELEHPTVKQIRNTGSAVKPLRIRIRVVRKFAHYLFWERVSFGYISEELNETEVFMNFDCGEHPTSFVRWFMKFVDLGEIVEPAYLQREVVDILNVAINKHTR